MAEKWEIYQRNYLPGLKKKATFNILCTQKLLIFSVSILSWFLSHLSQCVWDNYAGGLHDWEKKQQHCVSIYTCMHMYGISAFDDMTIKRMALCVKKTTKNAHASYSNAAKWCLTQKAHKVLFLFLLYILLLFLFLVQLCNWSHVGWGNPEGKKKKKHKRDYR